jgi:NTE family protein
MSSTKTVCLVLGSGSSRGWAHIGVIEALEKGGIPIDYIVGCSVGSYVGAIYAAGGVRSLKTFVLGMNGKKVFSYFDIVFPRSGLFDATKKVKQLFSMHTDVTDFSELKIPLMVVATDLETGGKVVLKSGSLFDALRATMSMPGLFAPARIKDRWLVDGGLVDPVPVGVARAIEADVVIAVDLNSGLVSRRKWRKKTSRDEKKVQSHREYGNPLVQKLADFYESAESGFRDRVHELLDKDSSTPDIIETVMTSIGIMQERITRINLAVEPPDVLLQPRLGGLKMMDFDQVERTIEEGYLAAREKIRDVKRLLEPA